MSTDMGKIYFVMGKSSSGKDTIFKKLLGDEELGLQTIVGYTTRPMRQGETEGVEYHFVSEQQMEQLEADGKVIEKRSYDTVYGIWNYFTVDDGQVDLKSENYIVIGTLESYEKVRAYYGPNHVVPLYIQVDDGVRLMRAIEREMQQQVPKYEEMCRRFLADAKDFSEERIAQCGIVRRYINDDMERCICEIKKAIV